MLHLVWGEGGGDGEWDIGSSKSVLAMSTLENLLNIRNIQKEP